MEKYSEVVGLPVICVDNGKKLGIVKDIIFAPKTREVKAILIERKGMEIRKRGILFKDIISFGKDAVVVNDCSCIKYLHEVEESGALNNKGKIKGLKIYTKSGNDLGVVEDVIFDYTTGLIEGLEVSDGLLQDIIKGRRILPLFGKVEFSEENILVDREAIEEISSTGGGIGKYFEG